MKKLITLALCMLSALLAITFSSSCSEENETKRDWRSELNQYYTLINTGDMMGIPMSYLFSGIRIMDSDGKDLLDSTYANNVLDGDFYFEIDGKKYELGDTLEFMPVLNTAKNERTVAIQRHMSNLFEFLRPFSFYTGCLKPEQIRCLIENSPLDIEYSFVWPSRNIRKNIRVYAEFNENYFEEEESMEPDENGIKEVPLYKFGVWVDGKSIEMERKDCFEIII